MRLYILVALVLFLLTALPAAAGEVAVLTTGFELRADRHEVTGGIIRFFAGDGEIQFPEGMIARIEREEPRPTAAPGLEAAPAPAPSPPSPRELVEQAAIRFGLPPALLHGVAKVESAYRPDAVSPKGAVGIMQLMPSTAALLNADPRDPAQNVDAGARHLRELLLHYNGQSGKALAAYNAGAKAVESYSGVPPYRETQLYVQKVLREYWKLAQQQQQQRRAR